jgi:hypothetical protein
MDHKQNSKCYQKLFTSQKAVLIILEWKAKFTKRSEQEKEGDTRTNIRLDSKATNKNE